MSHFFTKYRWTLSNGQLAYPAYIVPLSANFALLY